MKSFVKQHSRLHLYFGIRENPQDAAVCLIPGAKPAIKFVDFSEILASVIR